MAKAIPISINFIYFFKLQVIIIIISEAGSNQRVTEQTAVHSLLLLLLLLPSSAVLEVGVWEASVVRTRPMCALLPHILR